MDAFGPLSWCQVSLTSNSAHPHWNMGSYTIGMSSQWQARRSAGEISVISLELLVLVKEKGGVGVAAREVGVSQPQASRMIAALEKRLSLPLVRRTPLGSTLTEAGESIALRARQILAEYERLHIDADRLRGRMPEQLKLAASRTVGEQLVPEWTKAMSQMGWATSVSFKVDNSARIMDMVDTGEVPLGFVEVPQPPVGFVMEVLRRDRVVLIVPRSHPWSGKRLTVAELAGVRFVEREVGSGTRDILDVYLPQRALPIAEFDSNTAIVHAVAQGVGPAFLSELAIRDQVATGDISIVPIVGLVMERPLCAIWRSEDASLPGVEQVLSVVRSLELQT